MIVTLIDGREVDSASEEWRAECLERHTQVIAMRAMSKDARRDYLARVERERGQEASRRLAARYTLDWHRRRAEMVVVK